MKRFLPDFDDIIKKTLAGASPHSKNVFSQSPMTGEEVLDLLNKAGLQVIATVKPDGRPHIATTGLIVVDDRIYMGMDSVTRRYKNLKHNPSFAVMVAEGWKRQVIIEGEVNFLDMQSQLAHTVGEAQKKRYGWTTHLLAEITPRKIFTWKTPPKSQ